MEERKAPMVPDAPDIMGLFDDATFEEDEPELIPSGNALIRAVSRQ